jgi:asparagine synthase (glutamine-hydrolysing)
MCGITGFLNIGRSIGSAEGKMILDKMASKIAHRGPDDSGFWMDTSAGIGLAHRRLSIVDTSAAGGQPMVSQSGRYVISFNGEIYNHISIRNLLDQNPKMMIKWRGHSDTETLLAAIDALGINKTLDIAVGMFAIALWDRQERSLTLIRDRFGEKPIYYGVIGTGSTKSFVFASELSALKSFPGFSRRINRNALANLIRFNCVGQESCLYDGISKLLPGGIARISEDDCFPKVSIWWSVEDTILSSINSPFTGSAQEACVVLESLLRQSVMQQMEADVPVGVFLSGGIDSSAIAALAQAHSGKTIKTFSIGFEDSNYDESSYAKNVADHIGSDHTGITVPETKVLDVIKKMPMIYSEAFADPSQIATYLVCKLAKSTVSVALSGDGGDELFCGYNRYIAAKRYLATITSMPHPLRWCLGQAFQMLPKSSYGIMSRLTGMSQYSDKVRKISLGLMSRSVDDYYSKMISGWSPSTDLIRHLPSGNVQSEQTRRAKNRLGSVESIMLRDTVRYLPDDILVKVDRAAMAVGLETRAPFLDHRVFEFAWKLPLSCKYRNRLTKWPVRQVLYKYVPEKTFDRPKMGFGVPLGRWLRGPLRDWAEALLHENKLAEGDFFEIKPVREMWLMHLQGNCDYHKELWSILMFQAWMEYQNE